MKNELDDLTYRYERQKDLLNQTVIVQMPFDELLVSKDEEIEELREQLGQEKKLNEELQAEALLMGELLRENEL